MSGPSLLLFLPRTIVGTLRSLLLLLLRKLRESNRNKAVGAAAALWVLWKLQQRRRRNRTAQWPRIPGQPVPSLFQPSSVKAKVQRRRGYKNFPAPYPNGWMFVCAADAVAKGEVVPLELWGRELVAFRGEDGKAGVLGAYCPHMGTHVGHGGYVKGCAVVCPYHEWGFNTEGELVEIPPVQCEDDDFPRYSSRQSNKMRPFPVRELHGMVFAWMHADKAEPFDLWIAERPAALGLSLACRTIVGDFNMHVMEPAHNSCDWYHFRTVHSTLGQHWRSWWPKIIQPEIWSPPARSLSVGGKEDDGTELEPDVLITDQQMKQLHILGVPVPQVLVDQLMVVQVRFSGPMLGTVQMTVPVLGDFYGIVTMTPESEFKTHVELWSFTTWRWPRLLAWAASQSIMRTINQDREVWEHRTHFPHRNPAKNDYKWSSFDTWLKQFYSESSFKWGDDTAMDW